MKAQVYVVCNKTKLVGDLFEEEPNDSLGQITKSADLSNHGLQVPELSLAHHGLKG